MKKTMILLGTISALSIMAISCQREVSNVEEPSGKIHMTIIASGDAETRTILQSDGRTVLWDDEENLAVLETIVTPEETATSYVASSNGVSTDQGQTMTFDVEFDENVTGTAYTYNALYPNSSYVTNNNTNPESLKVITPTNQKATATSFDGDADLLIAKPVTETEQQTSLSLAFKRMVVVGKMTLNNVQTDGFVKSVKFYSEDKIITGRSKLNLITGEPIEYGYSGNSEDYVEVTYAANDIPANDLTVYFTCLPFEITAGEKFTVTLTTKDDQTFTREVTIPEGRKLSFAVGKNTKFSVDMTDATSGENTSLAGNYVILAKKDASTYYALKGEASGTRIASVDYSGSIENYDGTDASLVWTIAASGTSYTIKNGGNFIGWTSGNSADLIAEASFDANKCLMSIDQNTDGTYKIYVTSSTDRILARNTSNAYFAFYTGSQYNDIVLVPAVVDERETLTLAFDQPAINLTAAEAENFSGQDVKAYLGENEITGLTFTYTWEGSSDFGGVVNNTSTVFLSGDPGTATVTATFAGDDDYKPATASYTITVLSESGPQYELVSTVAEVVEGEYIITWDNTYYLPSGSTSGVNPAVGTGITVSSNKITNTVTDDMIWTFTGDNTNGFTISDGTNILHSTNAAQGISIVTSSDRKWTVSLDNTYGMLLQGDDGGSRYLAVYNSGSWRYYSKGTSYTGVLRLYKKVDSRADAGMSWSATTATASWGTGNIVSGFTAPTLTPGNATDISYESTVPTVATVTAAGAVTIVGPGETIIKAIFEGNSNYKPQTASYTLTVTDDRAVVATPVISPDATGNVASGTEVTITCATSDATIYYTLDGTAPTAGSTNYTGAIILTESKTVKAIAVKDGYKDSAVATKTYTVGVVNTSTEANPYSAADAVAIAGQLAANGTLADVYVSGIISAITSAYNSQYGNVSFNISADGLSTSTEFLLFRVPATSADDFKVGDAVEFKGTLCNYKATSATTTTPELQSPLTLIYQVHAPSISPNGGNFSDSQSVTITADNDATIRYTLDGTNPTETNGSTYTGAITLTETKTVKAIAVMDGVVTGVVTETYTKSNIQTESVDFSKQNYTNQQEITSYSGTDFTVTFDKGSNTNAPKYYTSGTAIRIYGGNHFTVSSSTKTISKIELTFGSSDGSNAITTDVATYSNGTWTGSSSSVKFTVGGTSGNRRLAGIKVYY